MSETTYYHNMFEEKKQRLKEYYREAKKTQYNNQ